MDRTDRIEFARIVSAMLETFGRTATDTILESYWIALHDQLSIDEVRLASKRCLAECEFYPKPVDLIERARPAIDPEIAAALCWETVIKAVRERGANYSVWFEDPITARAVRLIGWQALCDTASDEMKFARIEFCKKYQALYRSSNGPVDHPGELPGLLERARTEVPAPEGIVGVRREALEEGSSIWRNLAQADIGKIEP